MEFPYRKATKFSARSLGNLSDSLRKKLKLDNTNNYNVDTFKPLHIPSIPIPRRKPSTNLNAQSNSNLEQTLALENTQNSTSLNSSINASTSEQTQSAQPFNISSASVSDVSLPQAWQGVGLNNLTTAHQAQNPSYLQAISPNPRQSAEEQISPNKAQNAPTIKDFLEEDTQSSIDFPNDLPPWPEQDSSMSFELPQLHGDIDSSVDMDQLNKREVDFDQIQLDRNTTRDEDSMLSVDFEKPSLAPQDSVKADTNQTDFEISLDNINSNLKDSSGQSNLHRDYSDRSNLEKSKDNQANSNESEKTLPEFEYSIPAEAEDSVDIQESSLLTEDTKSNELSHLSEIAALKDIQNKTKAQEAMVQNAESSKNNQQQSLDNNINNQTEAVAKPAFGSTFSSFTSAGAPNQSAGNTSQASTGANLTFWHGVALPSVTSRLNPVKFQPTKPADFLKKPLPSKEQSEESSDIAKLSSSAKQSLGQLNSPFSQVESSIKKQAIADQSFASNNSEQLGLDKAALTVENQQNNQVNDVIEDADSNTAYSLESQHRHNILDSKTEELTTPISEAAAINPEDPKIDTSVIPNTASESKTNIDPVTSDAKSQPEQALSENPSSTAQPSTFWHGVNLSAVSKGSAQPTSQSSTETSTLTQPPALNENATLWHGISLSSVTSRGSNTFSSTEKLGNFSNLLTSAGGNGSESQDRALSIDSSIGKTIVSDNTATDGQNNGNTEESESLSQYKKRPRDEEEDSANQSKTEVLSDIDHANKASRIKEPKSENTVPNFQRSEEHVTSLASNKRSREEDEGQDDHTATSDQHIEKPQDEELANFSPLQSELSASSIQPPTQSLPTSFYNYPPAQSFTMNRNIISQGPTLERTPSPTWGSSVDNAANQSFPVSRTLIAQDPTLERTPSPTWGPSTEMPAKDSILEPEVEDDNAEDEAEEHNGENASTNPVEQNSSDKPNAQKKKKKKNKKKKKSENKSANNQNAANNNTNTNTNNSNNANNNNNNNNNNNQKPADNKQQKRGNKNKSKYKNKDSFHDYDQLDSNNQQNNNSGQDDFAQLLKAYQSQGTSPKKKQAGGNAGANKSQSQAKDQSNATPSSPKDDQPRRSSRIRGTEINYNENKQRKKSTN